jgi:hypothetical protein
VRRGDQLKHEILPETSFSESNNIAVSKWTKAWSDRLTAAKDWQQKEHCAYQAQTRR